MTAPLPDSARVVIVGGGIVGCSIAYHLAELGWKEILLLEQHQLTAGTTWHAAGLVGQLRPSVNLTKLIQYSARLYATLEAETGQATGLRLRERCEGSHQSGSYQGPPGASGDRSSQRQLDVASERLA